MELKSWNAKDISSGTRVFLRIDGNVPVKKGEAIDVPGKGRIAQTMAEIVKLRAHGARIIISTHLGDPKGVITSGLSTLPIAKKIEEYLRKPVKHLPGIIGQDIERMIMESEPGEILMLENLRFDAREEANDEEFAKALSRLADVYVNNAFGVCHRKHASVSAITRFLPSFAGELIEKEVRELSRPLEKPFVLMMGGAKLETKIAILRRLGKEAEHILLGGALALPFLHVAGKSLPSGALQFLPEKEVALARDILKELPGKIYLPDDLVVTDDVVMDIGPRTTEGFIEKLHGAKSLLWNGPFGVIEKPDGRASTEKLAKAIGKSGIPRTILGGGDSVAFLESKSLLDGFTHVSTGGGATLAFLSGEELPGLQPLFRK